MSNLTLLLLGSIAGAGAGLLAGLIGIGGGIIIVPVIFYGLMTSSVPPDAAAHIAVGTSLAAILPASIVSFLGHWRSGNTDVRFLVNWGPGIVTGVVVAQMAAPHVRGAVLSAIFGLLCLIFAIRFAFPDRFRPVFQQPPDGAFRQVAGVFIGVCSGFAGIGGGILTNILMTLSGLPMHKSIGRAAAVGIVVSVPATLTAALASVAIQPLEIGDRSTDVGIHSTGAGARCLVRRETCASALGGGPQSHLRRRAGGDRGCDVGFQHVLRLTAGGAAIGTSALLARTTNHRIFCELSVTI